MSNQIDHPYRDLVDGTWLRGNLHNHPRPRDRPDSLARRYAGLGYGFLALTEHDQTWEPAPDRHQAIPFTESKDPTGKPGWGKKAQVGDPSYKWQLPDSHEKAWVRNGSFFH